MSVLFLLLFIPNLFEIKSMQNILDSKNIIKTLFRQQKRSRRILSSVYLKFFSLYNRHTETHCIESLPCTRKEGRMFAASHAIYGGSLSSGKTYDPLVPPMSDMEKFFISQAFSSFFFLPNIYPVSFHR